MDPPPLELGTAATVEVVPHFDTRDGSFVAIVLIKERYEALVTGRVSRSGGAEIRLADELWDPESPETSSIRLPSDLCLRKPSTDVLVVGEAVSPARRPVRELDVRVRVGEMRKVVRVFGPRAWYARGLGSMVLTDPEPFESTPIVWERAFGGAERDSDAKRPVEEPRNPVGRGLVSDPNALAGTAGPSVESPDDLIKNHRSRPKPAGLAPICRNWAPRRDYSGTFDDAWMEERMPLLPLDFDDRFNQAAPPDQVSTQPLRGGERVEIVNMHEEGPFAFDLPKLHFFVGIQTADRMTEGRQQLDTVLIEANLRRVELTWRAVLPLPRRASHVRHVRVFEKRVL